MENRITVDFNALDRIVKKLNTAGNDLQDAVSILAAAHPTQKNGGDLRIQGASTSLRSVGGTVQAYNVTQAVQNYRIAVARLSSHSHALAAGVRSVSSAFRKAENTAGRKAKAGSTGEAAPKTTGGNGESGRTGFDWSAFMPEWSDAAKVAGEFGVIGTGVAAIIELVSSWNTGAKPAKMVLSLLKSLVKGTEKIAKGVSNNGIDWFGLAKVNPDKVPKTFGEAWSDSWGKYKVGDKATTAGKISAVAKWAGSILTVLSTGYENFTDTTENNSFERKVAETIGESAVKIVGGALIGSAVALLGGPAIVTGLITVGVTWGINSLSEAWTGKNAAEFISDACLDFGESIGSAIGDAVNTAKKKISGWWESLHYNLATADGGGAW